MGPATCGPATLSPSPAVPCPFYPTLQALVAFRRLQALQKLQPWPQVSLSTSSSQTSLAKPEKAPDSSYNDLDCKILQLCGEWGDNGKGEVCGQGETMLSPSWHCDPHTGELYDLDATSLQLKVINYVSSCSTSPLSPSAPSPRTHQGALFHFKTRKVPKAKKSLKHQLCSHQ